MSESAPSTATADLRDFVGPVWRRRWLVLAIVILSTVATYTASGRKTDRYRATTQVFVASSNIAAILGGGDSTGTERTTLDQAKLLRSRPVTLAVKARLHLADSPAALAGSVTAFPSPGSNFVTVTAQRATGAEAAAVANTYAEEYIRYRAAQTRRDAQAAITRISAQIASLPRRGASQQRRDLTQVLGQLKASRSITPTLTRQTDPATAPSFPFSPRPKRDAVFAFAISILLAIALAFALERFDRRIKRFEEVAEIYGVPLLATIPHTDTPIASRDDRPVVPDFLREPFRGLRTHLQLASLDNPLTHVAVTSAVSGEGKSTLTRNLALTYREWGLTVVVVEADLRSPTLSRLFGVESGPYGFTTVLTGESSLDQALVAVAYDSASLEYLEKVRSGAPEATRGLQAAPTAQASGSGLVLLPSGPTPPNPQAVLAADRTRQVVAELQERFDIVLIDTPPLLAVSDALPLISRADGVIIVSRVGMTERAAAGRLMTMVHLDPSVRVLGVVANDMTREPGSGYGYGYGYGYGERGHSNGNTASSD